MTAVAAPEGSRTLSLRLRTLVIPGSRLGWLDRGLFLAVVLLALGLYAWQLSGNGYGNTYYAAAARSMTFSWKNFLFGAFDPGGFITVDKPPVFLWFGALSARIFGYSSWAILAPSAVAGAASVGLLWLIVRRWFGPLAATSSAAVLLVTPITVAVNRLNLPEPFMLLFLIGAAGCVLQSLERPRWWAWAFAAGVLVGIAFNTKMLAAWVPGPAFALALVAGMAASRDWRGWAPKLAARLALLAFATFAVSGSWMLLADTWPASVRPYIGGSTDNTVYNLIVEYNGLGRVEGDGQLPGGGARPNANAPQGPAAGAGNGAAPGGAAPATGGAAPAAGPGNGAGGIIAGAPGLGRMFDNANGPQIAWFLPLAAVGLLAAGWQWRRQPVQRAALVLFAGWVLLYGGVFSYAQGIYHSYYTAAMAPAAAALAGIGIAAMAALVRRHPAWLALAAAAIAATAWLQLDLAGRLPTHLPSLPGLAKPVLAVGGAAALALAITAWRRRPALLHATVPLFAAGLLLIPGGWSWYEATNQSMNTTLPQAGPRQGAAGRSFGSQAFDQGMTPLAAWLKAQDEPGARWNLAVSSAQNASLLIAAQGLSVVPLGGFSGRDPTVNAAEFAELVAAGDVRFVLTSAQGPGAGGGMAPGGNRQPPGGRAGQQPPGGGFAPPAGAPGTGPGAATQTTATATRGATVVMRAVQAACTAVQSPDLPAQYQGVLYDCTGKADALRQQQP